MFQTERVKDQKKKPEEKIQKELRHLVQKMVTNGILRNHTKAVSSYEFCVLHVKICCPSGESDYHVIVLYFSISVVRSASEKAAKASTGNIYTQALLYKR